MIFCDIGLVSKWLNVLYQDCFGRICKRFGHFFGAYLSVAQQMLVLPFAAAECRQADGDG